MMALEERTHNYRKEQSYKKHGARYVQINQAQWTDRFSSNARTYNCCTRTGIKYMKAERANGPQHKLRTPHGGLDHLGCATQAPQQLNMRERHQLAV